MNRYPQYMIQQNVISMLPEIGGVFFFGAIQSKIPLFRRKFPTDVGATLEDQIDTT